MPGWLAQVLDGVRRFFVLAYNAPPPC
jgi:hypothetical protein